MGCCASFLNEKKELTDLYYEYDQYVGTIMSVERPFSDPFNKLIEYNDNE